jgi:hypothetical protein
LQLSKESKVVTIIKVSDTHYNLVELHHALPVIVEIPFKLTAERLMEMSNSQKGISREMRAYYQMYCKKYNWLIQEIKHVSPLLDSDDPIKRQYAKIKYHNLDDQLIKVETILLVDDK